MHTERNKLSHWRIGLAAFLIALLGMAIVWRLLQIQYVHGAYYRSLLDSLTTRYVHVPAERGNIYSADGALLATSVPLFTIRMDLRADGLTKHVFRAGVDSLAALLALTFHDRSASQYKRLLTAAYDRGDRYLLIKRNVTYSQLQRLRTFPIFRLGRYKGGLIVEQHSKRIYPYRRLARRTIGYQRAHLADPVGLEGSFHELLKGEDGQRLAQRISGGYWLPLTDDNEVDPKNGCDLITTLHTHIQDVADAALERALQWHQADHGCCIVMEVPTGAIRAMVNLGRQENGQYIEDYNYAIGARYEPGSTFKLASMIALLEDGYVLLEDTVDVHQGQYRFWNQTMRDAEQHRFGKISVRTAFAQSSNVGISRLVERYYRNHPQRFIDRLRSLRLDQRTGIELPGEPLPIVKSVEDKTFNRYSLPWMAVGYEVKLTPLQLLTLYNAVANGGTMMKPYLVERIEAHGKVVKTFEPQILKSSICSPPTLTAVRALLEAVVDSGTAKNIRRSAYRMAGKSGTSLVAEDEHGYQNKVYLSSFVGYLPADNPVYSIIVMIKHPKQGQYYGSQVAAPVFAEIADRLFASDPRFFKSVVQQTNSSLPPRLGSIVLARQDAEVVVRHLGLTKTVPDRTFWVRFNAEGVVAARPIPSSHNVMPDVRGMSVRNALFVLESAGLNVRRVGMGTVREQSKPPGTPIVKGEWVTLFLNEAS